MPGVGRRNDVLSVPQVFSLQLDFSGETAVAAGLPYAHQFHFGPVPTSLQGAEGYLAAMGRILEEKLKLELRMWHPPGGWGHIEPENGTWTGVIGALGYDRADLALVQIGMYYDRLKVRGSTQWSAPLSILEI